MAGLADDFDHFVAHKAGNDVIRQTLATRAVVVNQIAKPPGSVIEP